MASNYFKTINKTKKILFKLKNESSHNEVRRLNYSINELCNRNLNIRRKTKSPNVYMRLCLIGVFFFVNL